MIYNYKGISGEVESRRADPLTVFFGKPKSIFISDYRKKMKLSSLILSICSITDGAPGKSSKSFKKKKNLPVK